MTAIALLPREALSSVGRSLQLPSELSEALTDELIAQALRRAAFILAPCPSYALVHAARESLLGFGVQAEELDARVDDVVDALIAFGDILEMRAGGEDPWNLPDAYELRPAPPAFVLRKDGSIVLLGVAGDEITPLPGDGHSQIIYRGALRLIKADEGENLRALLKDIGLFELSEKTWLRVPAVESAQAHIRLWRELLSQEPASGPIEGLKILDTNKPPTFYRGRWQDPTKYSNGLYVARRPQRYGAARWCIVEFEDGVLKRFKDLVSPGDRLRPCDLAWRIQAALDRTAGAPQCYRCTVQNGLIRIALFSPLPSWDERHLYIVGSKTATERGLFAYDVPRDALGSEVSFLSEMLWMAERVEAGGAEMAR